MPYAPETGSAALATGFITTSVSALGQTTLGFLDAFCVTDRCKDARAAVAANEAAAEMGLEAAKYQALGAGLQAKAAMAQQRTILIIGGGALGLAAYWLLRRT